MRDIAEEDLDKIEKGRLHGKSYDSKKSQEFFLGPTQNSFDVFPHFS